VEAEEDWPHLDIDDLEYELEEEFNQLEDEVPSYMRATATSSDNKDEDDMKKGARAKSRGPPRRKPPGGKALTKEEQAAKDRQEKKDRRAQSSKQKVVIKKRADGAKKGHSASYEAAHSKESEQTWKSKPKPKLRPKPKPKEKGLGDEYRPDAAEKYERHQQMRDNAAQEKQQEALLISGEVRDVKRQAWDEALRKKKEAQDKARKKQMAEQRRIQDKQQAKGQVLQLVARINYALVRGGVRNINGVKVKDIRTLFLAMDADNSKCISKEELQQGLARLKVNIPNDAVDLLMSELDSDLSGTLEMSEFLKWWEQAEVVQAAAKANEDSSNAANSIEGNQQQISRMNRRVRSSASGVVAQLNFILKGLRVGKKRVPRKLYGKDIIDIRSFFNAIDNDNSGKIHPVEIAAGLKRLDITMTDGDIQAMVDTVDLDMNGQMDIMEIMAWADFQLVGATVAMQIREVFEEERTLFGYKVTDAASLFEAIDINGDGVLDFDEFVQGLKHLQLNVGFPELDTLLSTLGKDRSGGIDKEELIWVLDHKSQLDQVRLG